jgi:branched-chain amino acid transport system permease protein
MRASLILSCLCIILLVLFPLLAPALDLSFYISFVRRVMIFALAASSLNLILGYGGMVALGPLWWRFCPLRVFQVP